MTGAKDFRVDIVGMPHYDCDTTDIDILCRFTIKGIQTKRKFECIGELREYLNKKFDEVIK